jgi:hypothetical protein
VDTGTTYDSVAAGAAAASAILARLPIPVSIEPLTLQRMPAARATAAASMARNRPFLDDLEHVMGVPRALVGHYRRIDGARHLGEALDAFNRLLEIGDGCPRHAAEGADRLGGRRIALVGAVGTIRRDPYSRETRNVLAAFEILSPSTEERDLRWKRMAYPTLPPLTHYVVIAQDGVDIVRLRTRRRICRAALAIPR